MGDLTSLVDADDPIVADLLASTLELIVESGGWIDPRTRLVARDGQLAITSDAEDGALLLRVPRTACVRVDRVTWMDDDQRLTVAELPDDVGDAEMEMLYLQVALHNQCGKLPWLMKTHPSLARDLPDDVIDAVRELVPSFRTTSTSARDVLFANRCFRMQLREGVVAERVLLPVVDLLNHDASGATGEWDGAAFSVAVSRPFDDAECALDYGMQRDALEMAVVYGFADTSTHLAHSGPVTVDAPGIGSVRVLGTGRAESGALLPVRADLRDGTTVINRLTVDSREPGATLTELMTATRWDRATAASAVEAVVTANLVLLSNAEAACQRGTSAPATATLVAAADHQARVFTTSLGDMAALAQGAARDGSVRNDGP